MAERRSLGAAMDLTPDKLAFIKGDAKAASVAPEQATTATTEKVVEVERPTVLPEATKETPARSNRRTSRRANSETPDVSDILDQLLVPVTVRLPHRMAQALKRAHLEQKLKHAKPDTQQEIAEQALGDWLSKFGFLDS